MKKINVIFILLATIICTNISAFAGEFDNGAKSVCIMDRDSGRVIYCKNEHAKSPMASTTKIATAIVVIENACLEDIVTIRANCVNIEGSSVYLQEGQKWTVKDLLLGLMLRSGNDCAVALANHVSGSIDSFAHLMNRFAARIGCRNTHFCNPHGLHEDEHYTTAYDLAKISCYAMQNEMFREIVGCKKTKIIVDGKTKLLLNKNKLLYNYEAADGIKTGFTKKAGRCFVGSATQNGINLICVLLNDGPMFEDCQRLLSNAFFHYPPKSVVAQNKVFVQYCGDKRNVFVCKQGLILPTSSTDRVYYQTDFAKSTINVYLNGELFKTLDLEKID